MTERQRKTTDPIDFEQVQRIVDQARIERARVLANMLANMLAKGFRPIHKALPSRWVRLPWVREPIGQPNGRQAPFGL